MLTGLPSLNNVLNKKINKKNSRGFLVIIEDSVICCFILVYCLCLIAIKTKLVILLTTTAWMDIS